MSPALAGGFLTTAPPGKSLFLILRITVSRFFDPSLQFPRGALESSIALFQRSALQHFGRDPWVLARRTQAYGEVAHGGLCPTALLPLGLPGVSDIRPTHVCFQHSRRGALFADPRASAWWPSPRGTCPTRSSDLLQPVWSSPSCQRCLLLALLFSPFPCASERGLGTRRQQNALLFRPATHWRDSLAERVAP